MIANRGTAAFGNWHNDQLGISYQYPDGFTPTDPSHLPHNSTSSFTILAAFWKSPHDLSEPDLFISADDPWRYADNSALGYLHRIQNTVSDRFHANILQTDQLYHLSGVAFYRLDYEFPGSTPPVFKTALTGRVGSCEVTFQLTATSHDGIEQMFRSVAATSIAERKDH